MHVCMFTVDFSQSTLPQLFTGLCTVFVCCEHVRSVGADACGVADAVGGDTTRLAGVCLVLDPTTV